MSSPSPTPSSRRPDLFAVAGILGVLLLELLICKPRILLGGPLWQDEVITKLVVTDPSFSHAMGAVRHGVDTNPPVFHVIDRIVWQIASAAGVHSSEFVLRTLSLASIVATLIVLYSVLRRAVGILPALAGVAAVWAHPDVVEQATDARFYAPLLLMAVCVIWCVSAEDHRWWQIMLLVIASALLCTLHYFGILTLACIAAASFWTAGILPANRKTFAGKMPAVRLAMLAGPFALLPFIPWIHDQSGGLTVKTWLDPFSFYTAKAFLVQVLCPLAVFIVVITWALATLFKLRKHADQPIATRVLLPPLALIAVPLLIVAFSATVQSALRSRYAITAALALAPMAAMVARQIDPRLTIAMIVLLTGLSIAELHGNSARRGALLAQLTAESQECATTPIVFAARGDAMELQSFAPDLLPRLHILDEAASGVSVRAFRRYETDMVHKTAEWYSLPPLATQDQLQSLGEFHLIASDEDLRAIVGLHNLRHIYGDRYRASGD